MTAQRFDEVVPVTPGEASRFWRRVRNRGAGGECWPWSGATYGDSYGRMRIGGRLEGTHRIAFSLASGSVVVRGALRLVLHSCDNPICCNPAHLRLGSFMQNNADMLARGRYRTFVRRTK